VVLKLYKVIRPMVKVLSLWAMVGYFSV